MAKPIRIVDYTGEPRLIPESNKPTKAHLFRMSFTNFDAVDYYVHLYDAASADDVTPGTNIKETFHIAQERMTPLSLNGNYDTPFANGIVFDVTTDVAGTAGDPDCTAMVINGRFG